MSKDWKAIADAKSAGVKAVSKDAGDLMRGFMQMHEAGTKSAALDTKTKELIALSIGIATHCEGCIALHTKAAVAAGATREEFVETLKVAVYMGGGPSLMYAADALEAYEAFAGA